MRRGGRCECRDVDKGGERIVKGRRSGERCRGWKRIYGKQKNVK